MEVARFRAVVAYHGGRYNGFQRLGGPSAAPTVQGALEEALTRIAGEAVAILGAGRTDAGVHATGQVIAFDLRWKHSPEALLRAVNAVLPPDIALQQVAPAAPNFHPRYDATSRVYQYRVYVAETRQPLLDGVAWGLRPPEGGLNLPAMNAAASGLIGVHDFASFGNPPLGERGTTIREVFRAGWEPAPAQFGVPCYIFEIAANAFLYRMVRTLVGELVQIGLGRGTVAAFTELFRARDRARARHLAPPQGLTLTGVTFVENKQEAGRRPPGHET